MYAGAVITVLTGSSTDTPAATTRERRSRSVTIPSEPRSATTTEVAPASFISRAASRIVVSGSTTTGSARISESTGWCAGSRPLGVAGVLGEGASPARPMRELSSERATKPTLSGRASTAVATSAPIR